MNILHLINNIETKGGAESLVRSYCQSRNDKYFTIKDFFNLKRLKVSMSYIKTCDLIHVHLFPSLYLGFLLKFLFKKKIIFTEHNSWNRRRNKKYLRFLEKIIYIRYDLVLCISHSVKKNLEDWVGHGVNTQLLFNGIELEKKYYNFKCENKKSNFTILMTGSFTQQKNQQLLIELLKKNKDICLFLVGSGPTLENHKTLVNNLKLDDRVTFFKAQNHPINLPYRPDLYVQSSHWEGFGLTVIEAISDGIPVITSNVNGVNELIEGQILFDNSIQSLDQAVKKFRDLDVEEYLNLQKKQILKYNLRDHLNNLNQYYSYVLKNEK